MMEDFKRPDHPDFMTTSELKAASFCGIRHNSVAEQRELWVDGEVKFFVTKIEESLNPNIFEKKYADYFGFDQVVKGI